MATPHVSGTIALLVSADASLGVDQMESILMETAVPRTDSQYPEVPNNGYGHGLLNAFDAVAAVLVGRGTLEGRVVRTGSDTAAPSIDHTPPAETYAGLPLEIQAQVTDDVSVVRADLWLRPAGGGAYARMPMTRVSGDHTSGAWAAVVPPDAVLEPALEYYITAEDYGGNAASHGTAAAPHVVPVNGGLTPGYFQDFESNASGWMHGGTNDPWEWGTPSGSGPGGAHSGTKVVGTNLDGNYGNDTNAYVLMPPLDLSGVPSASLSFWHWYDLETGFDYADVFISADGETWDLVAEYNGASSGWQEVRIDLTPYTGGTAYVAFNLYTDASVVRPGWYLDDVRLNGPDDVPPAAPGGLTATPLTYGEVELAWTAPADTDLAGYRVYRSLTSGGPYEMVAEVAAPGTGYVDMWATGGEPNYYTVTGVDVWGNEGPGSAEASATPANVDVLFSDDMESGPGAWTHGGANDSWQHGAPAFSEGPATAYSGSNVWGSNLTGPYLDNADAWLMTPEISLAGYAGAALRFMDWYKFENNFDYGYLQISTNGGSTWTDLRPRVTNQNSGWTRVTINLDAYAGANIRLRWRYTTDGSVTRAGWYVDDVAVLGVVGAGSVPPPRVRASAKRAVKRAEPLGPLFELHPQLKAPARSRVRAAVLPAGADTLDLPMDATVSILETGRSVRTDAATGMYRMGHAAGTYTAVAEAYGYHPQTQTVVIADDGTTVAHFTLEPIAAGRITGTVRDSRTGDPVAGARIWVEEDVHIPPAYSGADGSFAMAVLSGSYTVHVTMEGYYPYATSVTVPDGGEAAVDAALRRFIGMPGELYYDDGSAENAWAFFAAENGWAVRFSLPEGYGAAQVTHGLFRFWDTSWPDPGGAAFRAEIWDAGGPAGAPGHKLGSVMAEARRDGTWTEVDLSSLGVVASGDFYIAYVQTQAYPEVPGLAVDDNGPAYERSWALVGDAWAPSDPAEGNRMIRARIRLEVGAPVITSPADGSYVSTPDVTVSGRSVDGTTVDVYRNGEWAAAATAEGGTWSAGVTLAEGMNSLTATASTGEDTTDPSAAVTVFLDRTPPTVELTEPADGWHTNLAAITVSGSAADNMALGGVTLNGVPMPVEGDGTFSVRMLVTEGDNRIEVTAHDAAGNAATAVRTVHVDWTAPVLSNMEPATDITLAPGESTTIRFESEPGLTAAYQVVLNTPATADVMGTPMAEVSPGVYEATYTAPEGSTFSAHIQLNAADPSGNLTQTMAPGRLTVMIDNWPPVAVIRPPSSTVRVNRAYLWDGRRSYDPDGTIVNWHWDMGDGTTYDGKRFLAHRYRARGTYTVRLTVTDNEGAVGVTEYVVEVQ